MVFFESKRPSWRYTDTDVLLPILLGRGTVLDHRQLSPRRCSRCRSADAVRNTMRVGKNTLIKSEGRAYVACAC
jgi:hypothetical protein